MKMGLREANQNFSKAMKAVKAGKVVILTERGNPIATIQPYRMAATLDDAIVQLEQEGILRPNPKAASCATTGRRLRQSAYHFQKLYGNFETRNSAGTARLILTAVFLLRSTSGNPDPLPLSG